ncbi:MAG: o-succinylbenzoate synthase, partial [Pontibacter sp.]|nr:o-succinylbenzoate synthase [Pontibacter sp.]
MSLQISYTLHTLQFKFDARTSRGAIREHNAYLLKIWDTQQPDFYGMGECAPLAGLSIDYRPDLVAKLEQVVQLVNSGKAALQIEEPLPKELALTEWPALQFALETALLDLQN